MGKKSRRVRDGTQYSGVKTHIVLWKSGTAIKKTLSVDLARGGTFKDMKLTLESVTSVPVARLYLAKGNVMKENECPDDAIVDKTMGPMEGIIMREKELKRNVARKVFTKRRYYLQGVAPPNPLSAYTLYFRARYREDRAQGGILSVEVNAFAASIAAEWKALSDADAAPWHAGAKKEDALFQSRHRFCELSGEQLVGQKFSDDREKGRGPGRVLAMLEMKQDPHPDALAYHCIFDDMRQGGETLSLSELHARVCCDARAARRAAKKSFVVGVFGLRVNWRFRPQDTAYKQEIPYGLASPLGRFISHADLVRLNKATAAIRRNMGDGERKAFGEYTSLILMQRLGAEGLPGALKGIGNWPRFRPYWRRVRRRVCAHCFKRADLSEPRYLVCSGCGKARYCSEACQRLDWAEHQEKCPAGRIHVPVRRG